MAGVSNGAQTALSAVLCHALLIGGRSPPKLLFERASGRVWQADAVPSYDAGGRLERAEPVPFRLTRNLATFFTPFGVEGVFVGTMAVAAAALLAPGAAAADGLALFLREDGAACAARRRGAQPQRRGHVAQLEHEAPLQLVRGGGAGVQRQRACQARP